MIPVSDDETEFADQICREISRANIRADVDDREDTVGKKIRNAEREWIPYIIVVGPRERDSGVLSVRRRDSRDQIDAELPAILKEVQGRMGTMPRRPLSLPPHLSQRPVFYG